MKILCILVLLLLAGCERYVKVGTTNEGDYLIVRDQLTGKLYSIQGPTMQEVVAQ
jgi:hypothetical protein